MTSGESILRTHFVDAFRQIKRQEPPEIHASFYPFTELKHTIRVRNQRVYVRVSDILRDAPPSVYRALAFILVSKLFNRRVENEHQAHYRQYAYQRQVERAMELARKSRGRKVLTGAVGRAHNLDKLFARLNRRYFDNQLPMPALSWSARRSKRILGHHDYAHEAIVISRLLDSAEVPEFFVEFVLYHEMLHIRHQPRVVNGRRVYHSPAFRADERRFERFEDAMDELEKLSRRK